jgi:carbamoyl-phosphate synthase large subunit
MAKRFVGVSGINAIDNPGPGIGVARSLKEDPDLDVAVVGLAYDAMDPGIYMDWVVDKSFIMPYPSGGGQEHLDRLFYIQESHGLDFVIPNLDAELPLYIKYADLLRERGIGTFLPDLQQFRLRTKDRLGEVAERIGLAMPRTRAVTSEEAFYVAVQELGLPVMVKGIFYSAFFCQTMPEALGHYSRLVAEWGYPIIVQEVVSGDELNVVGLGDGEGGALGLVAAKKVLTTASGKIWTGVTVRHERMLGAAAKLLSDYRWRGPFELECIVRGDQVFLIEVNPRFPAWSYFATGVGVNLPARMLRRALDLPVPPDADYEAGKVFVRYSYELVTDMDRFRQAVSKGETP